MEDYKCLKKTIFLWNYISEIFYTRNVRPAFKIVSGYTGTIVQNSMTRLSSSIERYYLTKKRGPVTMIFRYAFQSSSGNYHVTESFLCGAIQLFSRTNLRYQTRPLSSLPFVGRLFVFLVAKIEVSASAWPGTDTEQEVYVVNLES